MEETVLEESDFWLRSDPNKRVTYRISVVLSDVHVNRGIFQGDRLPPLLFVLSVIPVSLVLRKVNAC